MVAHTPAGIVATTFLFLYEKNSSFPGRLSHQLSGLPGLTVARIGSLLNWMAEKNITNGAVCPTIAGNYPEARIQGGGNNYHVLDDEVKNALQRLTMQANLVAAMQCVVNIQDSFFALGVDKVTGALDSAGRATHHIYNGLSVYKGYGDKGKSTLDMIKLLRDYVQSQRGDPVNIFINAM